jgi:hypothetical protein
LVSPIFISPLYHKTLNNSFSKVVLPLPLMPTMAVVTLPGIDRLIFFNTGSLPAPM